MNTLQIIFSWKLPYSSKKIFKKTQNILSALLYGKSFACYIHIQIMKILEINFWGLW